MTDTDRKDERKAVDALADELFQAVEEAQGYAFISDGETFRTTAEFFNRVQGRLAWSRLSVELIEKFLVKHGKTPNDR